MVKKNISKFNKCVNCGACLNACPVDAISLCEDSYFYKYIVDDDKCINCSKCMSLCPANNDIKNSQNLSKSIGGWCLNKNIVEGSSSGGAFAILANYVLERNGIVYGAVFSEDSHSVVIEGTDFVNVERFRKSKYVESKIGYSYRKIKRDLDNGKLVLFSGAPCQVIGLKIYLEKEYDNLITCDFACGGMPSHKLYEIYLKELEEKYKSTIKNVDFRSGQFGWEDHSMLCTFQNGKKYREYAYIDPFYFAFIYKHLSIRDNCIKCEFADNHYSDIILADFWKYKTLTKFSNKTNGISLIISNSKKGDMLFNYFKKI